MVLYLIWWFRFARWVIIRLPPSVTSTALLGSSATVPLAFSTCRSSTVCFIMIIVIIVVVIVVVSSTVSSPSWPICKVEKIDSRCNQLLLIKRFLDFIYSRKIWCKVYNYVEIREYPIFYYLIIVIQQEKVMKKKDIENDNDETEKQQLHNIGDY